MWTIMSRLRHFAITGTKIIGNFNCELQLEIIALRQQNFKAGCILLFLVILFRGGVFLLQFSLRQLIQPNSKTWFFVRSQLGPCIQSEYAHLSKDCFPQMLLNPHRSQIRPPKQVDYIIKFSFILVFISHHLYKLNTIKQCKISLTCLVGAAFFKPRLHGTGAFSITCERFLCYLSVKVQKKRISRGTSLLKRSLSEEVMKCQHFTIRKLNRRFYGKYSHLEYRKHIEFFRFYLSFGIEDFFHKI